MKLANLIVVTLFTVFLTLPAFAETNETSASQGSLLGGVKLIPLLALNYFSVEGAKDDTLGEEGKSGVSAGILAGMNFGAFDIETGLMYLETGAYAGELLLSATTTISYLAVPVYVKAPLFESGDVNFYGRAGALVAFKMDAKIEGGGFADGLDTNISDEINSFDVMGQLGLGGDYQLQPNILVGGELSFIRGFQEVVKDAGGYNQGVSAAVTMTISI